MKKIHKRMINLFLTAAVVLGGLLSVSIPADAANPDTMEVHFIDVGQGDSTLITCGEHAMLIDAGDDTKGTAIQNYLQKRKIKKLDYLILTHPDADHIGGAPVIITKFDIDKVFVSNYEKDTKTYQKLIQALDDKRLKYMTPGVGSQYTLGTAPSLFLRLMTNMIIRTMRPLLLSLKTEVINFCSPAMQERMPRKIFWITESVLLRMYIK